MSTTTAEKTAKELEQEQALKQLNALLDASRPKGLKEGLGSGLSNIVQGAVGAVGIAVLAPTLGLAVGATGGGILGGIVGLTGGAVVGLLGAGALAVGGTLKVHDLMFVNEQSSLLTGLQRTGVVSGVTQIGRGVINTPAAIIAPIQGKWWNEAEGKWILTDLPKDSTSLVGVPEDDSDLLGKVKQDLDQEATAAPSGAVKDTYYYDILGVSPQASPFTITRRYYLLALENHPDIFAEEDAASSERSMEIAEAYQVLGNPELRAKYDQVGRDGLNYAVDIVNIDPAIFVGFLFGSYKFQDYVGQLAVATAASIGGSPEISFEVGMEIQQRRVLRLALKLVKHLQPWVEGDSDACKTVWATEAADLANASYGTEMVHLIGKVRVCVLDIYFILLFLWRPDKPSSRFFLTQIYNLAAVKFLGSIDSGLGMPSIAEWTAKQHAKMQQSQDTNSFQLDTLKGAFSMLETQEQLMAEFAAAITEEEKKAIQDKMVDNVKTTLLQVLWTATAVDITSTLYEVVTLVCFDHAVDKATREKRAEGIKALGQIFMDCPAKEDGKGSAEQLYQEAAFAAMVETIMKKEEASHHRIHH